MKRTLIAAAALAACAGTQLFAQSAKEGVMTFALTSQAQSSVSTSSVANMGNWSQQPPYYTTAKGKFATADIIQDIAYVLHNKNANFYASLTGTRVQLVLVQGELSGFFNLSQTPNAPDLTTVNSVDYNGAGIGAGLGGTLPGVFNITPDFSRTTIDQGGTFAQLATGRHLQTVPWANAPVNTIPYPTTGAFPVGHHQPWGQIYIKCYDTKGVSVYCENVTPFFAITVEECYDCFYLNSFITDSKFKYQTGASGLPCCTTPQSLIGSGKDQYYMTLSFDNTINNPFLNPASLGYVGASIDPLDPYNGVTGVDFGVGSFPGDGTTPDFIRYYDPIKSGAGKFIKYAARLTLNGILTYTWSLKFVNKSDAFADFVGSASYAANGYGFISLRCSLLTGTASIVEKVVPMANCCMDDPWYNWWYGIGWNYWQDPWGGVWPGALAPGSFQSPINTEVDLSFHAGFDEEYEVGEQWLTNPTWNGHSPTIDPLNPWVNVPTGP